jgi:predicted N-acetyltransferase YhbS
MIDRLRQSEALLPMLSLVADIDGTAVGHLLLTWAWIGSGAARNGNAGPRAAIGREQPPPGGPVR